VTASPNSNVAAYQLLTGPGPAAIAVVRLHGAACPAFIQKHLKTRKPFDPIAWQPGRVFRAELIDADQWRLDDILVSIHNSAPEWDLRLHLHGGRGVVRGCLDVLQSAGFAETPGTAQQPESALWIGDNSIETEAYAILPSILTLRGVQWLLAQTGLLTAEIESILTDADRRTARQRCQALLSRRSIVEHFIKPLRVALLGPPNVGKSTLANALADREVSLVSPLPGTTRDWLEIPGEIDGFPILWLDTAGLWSGGNAIDKLAIDKTIELSATADLVLLILDPERVADFEALTERLRSLTTRPIGYVMNKIDDVPSPAAVLNRLPAEYRTRTVAISAINRRGLDLLERNVLQISGLSDLPIANPAVFTNRQAHLLETAVIAGDTDFPNHLRTILEG
jgi:tRNA modification GTPase